jgi:hypothetical protein
MSPSHEITDRRTCLFCNLQKYSFGGLLAGRIREFAYSVGLLPAALQFLLRDP